MASIPFYGYNYDPGTTDTQSTGGTYTISWGPSRYGTGETCSYSTTYIEIPAPDDAEDDESGPPSPWWWLVPEDEPRPAVRGGSSQPLRRPARCRDPPG